MIEFTVSMLSNVENELDEWVGRLTEQIKKVTAMYQQAKTVLESRIDYTKKQITQIENELKAADQVINNNNKNEIRFKKQIEENKKTIESCKSEIAHLQSAKSSAEGDKSSYDSQISNLRSQIKELESENVELKEKIALIHENKERLFSIKSSLRTSKEKCESYVVKLRDAKEHLNSSYSYFIEKVAPYVMDRASNEIIPKMRQAIIAATNLASAMLDLGGSPGSNVSNVEISVSSGSAFKQTASNLDREIDTIKNKMDHSSRSTKKFRNGLNDRVSVAASELVSQINRGIDNIMSNSLKGYVNKLQNIAGLCERYESIDVNA